MLLRTPRSFISHLRPLRHPRLASTQRLNVDVTPSVLSLKPITPNDAYVSCTIFNKNGDVTAVSRRFPKWSFLRDHSLYPRDLRKIDTSSVDVIPSIVVKPTCILVNLLYIKALVQKDSVFVFDTSNPEAAMKLGVFVYDLESKLSMPATSHITQPYEHRALESILMNVTTSLETEYKQHYSQCGMILNELEDEINRDKLRDLLINSKNLTAFYQKSLLVRDVLDELLDSDEDLAQMHLSSPKSVDDNFSDVEMLLETYYKQCDEYVHQSETLIRDIKSTEEIVNIILDANRNALMLFELKVTIYTLGFTIATLVPAFYGMNLKNFIEESNWGFFGVTVFSIASALALTWSNLKSLRSVRKLTMMNYYSGNHGKHLSEPSKIIKNGHVGSPRHQWMRSARTLWFGSGYPVRDGRDRELIWKWLLGDTKK
ncbi:LAMI_0F06216g1_1 [Lachancea mirantina]|uniref:Magnesium transporter n=1 Tax=Lachancea mirantina TaxID=1230905 RepID=A0A1G4JZ23_9SACH|nr:LAMI_0F06216g1_1 [Lachancea mirantina]